MARYLAQNLSVTFGKPFLVENKPGAGGLLGIEAGVKSAPDGHTLLMLSGSYAISASLYKLDFDPIADITPLIQVAEGPQAIVVNPEFPARSVAELIALARQNPGMVSYASSGPGTITHVSAELFSAMAGIKMLHVPYKGTGPAVTDTVGGQTNVYFGATASTLPHIRSGRLRVLAVTTLKRSPWLPDVPTVDESGLPGFEVVLWHGLIGPKGLPPTVVTRINAEVTKLLALERTAEQLHADGVAPAGGTPEQFLERIRKDIGLWRKVVTDAGIKAD
jgi:tripartite-type tricarboxylate transporter receptor subunit TctC